MKSKKFQQVIAETPQETKDLVRFNLDVLDRLNELLEKRFEGKQRLLAKAMGKSQPEISKWFNGYQNFTTKTLLALGRAFGEPVIAVCSDRHENTNFVLAKNNCHSEVTTLQIEATGTLLQTQAKYTPTKRTKKKLTVHTEELS